VDEEAQSEYRIEPLENHNRAAFSCGVDALDSYFRSQVTQDIARRIATAFVLTTGNQEVAGFYTLSSLSISNTDLPEKLAKKLPSRNPIGVTLLGRMAIHTELKGKGLGEFLLMHALERALAASKQVASFAVVVDPKGEARNFYLKYEFIPLSQPNRLFLPMKTIEKLFITGTEIGD
jgi:predicted GNAT family N-acyltransferase